MASNLSPYFSCLSLLFFIALVFHYVPKNADRIPLFQVRTARATPVAQRSPILYTTVSTDFEKGPGEWNTWISSAATATADFQSKQAAYLGKYGLKFNISQGGNETWYAQLRSPRISMRNNSIYNFRFWAKADHPASVVVMIMHPTKFTVLKYAIREITPDWRSYALDGFTPDGPADGVEANSMYTINCGNNSAVFYFDNLQLIAEELDEAWGSEENITNRIEKHRKGNFKVFFASKNGMALPATFRTVKYSLTKHDFLFGTAFRPEEGTKHPHMINWYKDTAAKMFNAIVPENVFKWAQYEPEPNVTKQDIVYEMFSKWGQDNGIVHQRGHALEYFVDNYMCPMYDDWKSHWSRSEGCLKHAEYLKQRITRDVTLFRGKLHSYDVWNELSYEHSPFIKNCRALGQWGSLTADAFRWAAAADPSAKLCLNHDGSSPNLLSIAQEVKSQKAPIHCIGVQAHYQLNASQPNGQPPTAAVLAHQLDKLAAVVPSLYITEFDLHTYRDQYWCTLVSNMTEKQQAVEYERYIKIFFSHPNVEGVWLWGFWDGMHWIENGGIYRLDGTPKPAAIKLQNLWAKKWTTKGTASLLKVTKKGPHLNFRGFFGTYKFSVDFGNGTVVTVKESFRKSGPREVTVKL